jgi:hypothetical protein
MTHYVRAIAHGFDNSKKRLAAPPVRCGSIAPARPASRSFMITKTCGRRYDDRNLS